MAHDEGGRDAAMETDASASVGSSNHGTPAADGGKSAPSKAGSSSVSQGGMSASTAANGGGAGGVAVTKPQESGGAGSAAPAPSKPSTPDAGGAGAAAPAQPRAGAQPPPPPPPPPPPMAAGTGGSASAGAPGTAFPLNPREALVDAVIGVLNRNGSTNQGDWDNWRKAAGTSGELSPEFVTPMLNSLLVSGTCFQRIEACISVCVVVSQNCQPCVADMDCRAALSRVCGEKAASCPMTMPSKP